MSCQTSFPRFDPALLIPMQHLWEEAPELSVTDIGKRLGVSKNTVIGQAHRRNWKRRRVTGSEPTTLHDRMDALDAALNAVLAETRPFVEGRQKLVIADPELVGVGA